MNKRLTSVVVQRDDGGSRHIRPSLAWQRSRDVRGFPSNVFR